ncbi:MAG: glycosyltransferase family 39 protein [Candidatus Roizmanbacteria bacterium]|nr:glycosyltransferase family 39 protein [Candidatus Roizmanbacteria bacterium]
MIKSAAITRLFLFTLLTGFLLRILWLSHFPVFTDEAIYAHWAQGLVNGTLSPFISISDGKTPLFIWAIAAVVKLGIPYTLAGRILSACGFIGTALFIYLLSKKTMKGFWIVVPTFLYALSPFTLFFERMGLMDSLLTFFSTGFLYFTYLFLTKKNSMYRVLLASLFLSLAFMTKPSALLFVYTSTLIPLLYIFIDKKKALYSLLLVIPTLFILFLLSRSSGFSAYSFKNMEFTYPLTTDWQILLNNLIMNIKTLAPAFALYFLPVLILFPFALYYLTTEKQYELLLQILLYMLIPVGIVMVFGRIVFSRYFLSFVPLIFFAQGYTLMHISNAKNSLVKRGLLGISLFGTLLYFAYGSSMTLTDPSHAFLSKQDRWQYITSTASGFGMTESIDFIKKMQTEATIVTTQDFGNLPYIFDFAFEHEPKITIKGTWTQNPKTIQSEMSNIDTPLYVVYNLPLKDMPKSSTTLKQLFAYTRPGNISGIRIFELIR